MEWKQERFAFESDLVCVGNNVIGRTWNGDLLALDLATGNVVWKVQPQEYVYRFVIDDSPIESGGVIYFGGVDGNVYAVDGEIGAVEWKRETGTRITTPPITDGTDLYVGTADSVVHRLSIVDGSVTAVHSLDGRPFGRATLTENRVLLPIRDLGVVSLDRNLETVSWTWEAATPLSTYQPLLREGVLFAGTRGGRLLGLDVVTGEELYTTYVGDRPRGIGGSGDTLFVGTLGGTLHALRIQPLD